MRARPRQPARPCAALRPNAHDGCVSEAERRAGPAIYGCMLKVFVYGTLKRGFPFHPLGLADAAFLGPVRTLDPYPMMVAGSFYGPMMLDRPGEGLHVEGELYRIEPGRLPKLDELEDVGRPGSFRTQIRVRPIGESGIEGEGGPIEAIGFMKSRDWLDPVHTGYLSDYQDRRFVPPWER